MKKQLIKEVLDINKLLKKEEKQKNESNIEIKNLEQEINSIEDKLKSIIKNQNEYDKLPKISILAKLYEKSKKINREKTFIENNLIQFKKENESKEAKLEKYFRDLKEKEIKNDELIEKKIDELAYEYERFQRRFPDEKKQEQYIISPETMSIHMISKITTEIDFMNTIRKQIKNIKFKNEKILKEIDSEKKNYILHQLENLNNNININNEIQDSTSSISMEIETNLNLDNLPSDDESLRFIDKVFDIKSNIKPIKNKIKTQFFPPSASIPMEKTKKAEPIKIERPVDYKEKKENIEKKIEILKKEIEEKKAKIESFKTKRIKIEEDNNKKEENLKHANMKIKIIKDQIDVIKKQIEEFEENKNNDKYEYLRMFSICNIVNNRNYYLYNINNQNNVSDLETFRK